MKSVTVYCSSSGALEPHFTQGARDLGHALADRGIALVYGGGSIGLMGECARAAKERGGRVIGIITTKLMDLEQGWSGCDEFVVVDTMQQRRRILMDRADGYVVLPGGLGTYEEFFEVLVARQLGDHHKPIAIVNHDGYYDPLVAMIEHGIEHRFVRPAVRGVLSPAPIAERGLVSFAGPLRRAGSIGEDAWSKQHGLTKTELYAVQRHVDIPALDPLRFVRSIRTFYVRS